MPTWLNPPYPLVLDQSRGPSTQTVRKTDKEVRKESHTKSSFGVFLTSGSLNKQLSMNASAAGCVPGGNLGAGSLTMCCKSSRMLIVMPPPWRDTPLLFRLSFFAVDDGGKAIGPGPGFEGESVPSKSERSESSSGESEKGKRPSASSIREIPRDQTSDFTVYWAP